MGYGAMQLAGPGVFGPPRDPAAAHAVLHEALDLGINHIHTSPTGFSARRCIRTPTAW
jgi:pyridoxine 4-dehydrogenase